MVSLPKLGIVFGLQTVAYFLSEKIELLDWPKNLPEWPQHRLAERFSNKTHGDFPRWFEAINAMPEQPSDEVLLDEDAVRCVLNLSKETTAVLQDQLMHLHPWRKGPFQIGDIRIDTEWHSDWKWQRLSKTLGTFNGQRVLDIGCGNGYFGWRMLGAGAKEVVGIDPTLLFCMQHQAIQKYFQEQRNWVLPLKVEEIPITTTFDRVLSMGVLYHRRAPQEHIDKVFALTEYGGQGIIETLVVETTESLYPEDRYARMRNVWCVPTVDDLCSWMTKAGFSDIQVIDVCTTSFEEQRSTPWMHFESLVHSLNPKDQTLTVEGHPRPVRAMVVGSKN
jgi:tRNA (mo5U34)-methyltransferase